MTRKPCCAKQKYFVSNSANQAFSALLCVVEKKMFENLDFD